MRIVIRTVLLALILSGSCAVGQAQIEQHGWKLVYVGYVQDDGKNTPLDKWLPISATFVRDYPRAKGDEYPKLLTIDLQEDRGNVKLPPSNYPGLQMTLVEFNCSKGLQRKLKSLYRDGTEAKPDILYKDMWADIRKGSAEEAMLKYACRPRNAPDK